MLKKFIFVAALLLIVVSVAILNLERNTKLLIQYYWEDFWSTRTEVTFFIGSSTIARLPGGKITECHPLKLRGFENGLTSDVLNYVKVLPWHKVKSLVLYIGENDIARGASVDEAFSEFTNLLEYIDAQQENISEHKLQVALLTIKNSPRRFTSHYQFEQFNYLVSDLQANYANLQLLPLASITSDAYYLSDGIHLNSQGYQLLNTWLNDFCA